VKIYRKCYEIGLTTLEFLIIYKKNHPGVLKSLREKRKKPVCVVVVVVVVSHGFSKKDRDKRFFAKDQEFSEPGLNGSFKQYLLKSRRYLQKTYFFNLWFCVFTRKTHFSMEFCVCVVEYINA
jgi:hypothetical protein